jgi:hypothetical protein
MTAAAMDELMEVINRYQWPMPFPWDRAEVRRVLCRLAADPYRGAPPDERFTLESILSVFLLAEKEGDELPPEAKNIAHLTRRAMAETMVN